MGENEKKKTMEVDGSSDSEDDDDESENEEMKNKEKTKEGNKYILFVLLSKLPLAPYITPRKRSLSNYLGFITNKKFPLLMSLKYFSSIWYLLRLKLHVG